MLCFYRLFVAKFACSFATGFDSGISTALGRSISTADVDKGLCATFFLSFHDVRVSVGIRCVVEKPTGNSGCEFPVRGMG